MRNVRLIILILFFMGLSCSIVFADFLPHVSMQHEAIEYFAAEARLVVDAQLNDTKGIAEARCYFKTDSDINYLFVSLNHLSGSSYQCTLPGFKAGSQELEYFFLIVNGSSQVIRSAPYYAKEVGSAAVPQGQATTDPATILYVHSELEKIEKDDTGIFDDEVVLSPTTDLNQLYGLRAGVYEPDVIPDTLNAMPGYFGGFILERIDNTIRPVKGFAPNLNPSLLKSTSATDGDQDTVDVQMYSSVITDSSLITDSSVITDPSVLSDSSEPPQIGGANWSGYFTRTDSDVREDLTASVVLTGYQVSITTTLTGLGHYLSGTINSSGDMLLYDSYDGEDWTTHFGPATSTEINIYDYIWPPVLGEPEPPLNAIILYRPPLPPKNVQASDGLYPDEITVSWNLSEGATLYDVYSCSNDLTDSCKFLSEVSTTEYVDTRGVAGKIFFRIQACNTHGCGQFSDYDIGYNQHAAIPHILHLLLRS